MRSHNQLFWCFDTWFYRILTNRLFIKFCSYIYSKALVFSWICTWSQSFLWTQPLLSIFIHWAKIMGYMDIFCIKLHGWEAVFFFTIPQSRILVLHLFKIYERFLIEWVSFEFLKLVPFRQFLSYRNLICIKIGSVTAEILLILSLCGGLGRLG